MCIDSAYTGRSVSSRGFDGSSWYFVLAVNAHLSFAIRSLEAKTILTKLQSCEIRHGPACFDT